MIRILQAVNIMDRAGLETMLMNYYRNINRSEIQFDFLTHRSDIGAYEEEIKKMGGKVYHAPRLYPQNYISYFKYMKNFFEEHSEYQVVHSHIDAMSAFPLYAAMKNNVRVRIAHSHNTKLDKDLKWPIKFGALKCLPKISNYYLACGEMAGKFMFGDRPFDVINNAIDLKKFAFDKLIRRNIREKLNLDDKFVIGHVGRYRYVKNQMFLLDVMQQILIKNPRSHLLLIGKGEDEQKIREKINFLNLNSSVSLLIDRSDVHDLYQAMDVFVMPSLFEGLPLVAVEAQANGLPCVVSDMISREVLLTDNTEMISLRDGVDKWVDTILSVARERNKEAQTQLQLKGYDIKIEAHRLEELYKKLYKG